MAAGHAHALYVHGDGPLHGMRPECKVAAHLGFVVAVVATPREAFWAFGVYAAIMVALIGLAGLRPGRALRRLGIEVPFVAFALLLPFLGGGERTDVLGIPLAVEGLWGAWNILAKATLGVAASVVLSSTTTIPDLLKGLERLHVPRALTSVAGFMVRYLDVIAAEMGRMRVARISRGHDPRWLWQAKAVASGIGSLFLRSYERGERVYLAMLSRGYAGSMPRTAGASASGAEWTAAMSLPVSAGLVAVIAWTL